jgi:hypothetical protein
LSGIPVVRVRRKNAAMRVLWRMTVSVVMYRTRRTYRARSIATAAPAHDPGAVVWGHRRDATATRAPWTRSGKFVLSLSHRPRCDLFCVPHAGPSPSTYWLLSTPTLLETQRAGEWRSVSDFRMRRTCRRRDITRRSRGVGLP